MDHMCAKEHRQSLSADAPAFQTLQLKYDVLWSELCASPQLFISVLCAYLGNVAGVEVHAKPASRRSTDASASVAAEINAPHPASDGHVRFVPEHHWRTVSNPVHPDEFYSRTAMAQGTSYASKNSFQQLADEDEKEDIGEQSDADSSMENCNADPCNPCHVKDRSRRRLVK